MSHVDTDARTIRGDDNGGEWLNGYWPGGMSQWSPGDTWASEDLPFLTGKRVTEAPPPIARGVARRLGLRKPKAEKK